MAESDIATLFYEDVDGFLLAACYDADTAGLYNGYEKERKPYSDDILQLKEPYQYFQAGVLVMNLAEFRRAYSMKDVLEFSGKEKWQLQDQDVLNKLCEGRVKYVDMAWNVMADNNGIRIKEIISLAPHWLDSMYMEARKKPKIIHYAGLQKPWQAPDMDFGWRFWNYARGTPYYEVLLGRIHSGKTKKNHILLLLRFTKGFFRRWRQKGFVDAVKYIPKKLFGKT